MRFRWIDKLLLVVVVLLVIALAALFIGIAMSFITTDIDRACCEHRNQWDDRKPAYHGRDWPGAINRCVPPAYCYGE